METLYHQFIVTTTQTKLSSDSTILWIPNTTLFSYSSYLQFRAEINVSGKKGNCLNYLLQGFFQIDNYIGSFSSLGNGSKNDSTRASVTSSILGGFHCGLLSLVMSNARTP